MRTDNGIHFTDSRPVSDEAEAAAAPYWTQRDEPRIYRWHAFDWACKQTKIQHRLTKLRCQRTDGQVERRKCPIKDATVKRYDYVSHDQLHPLELVVEDYIYVRRLETLRGIALRIYLPSLDQTARTVQGQTAHPHAGTEHI